MLIKIFLQNTAFPLNDVMRMKSNFSLQYWTADETCVYDADVQHGLPELIAGSVGTFTPYER